jgi:hypothetical protein
MYEGSLDQKLYGVSRDKEGLPLLEELFEQLPLLEELFESLWFSD